jgi:protein-disulfide isomerase
VKTGKARYEYRVYPTAGGPLTVFLGGIAACLDNQRDGAFWQAKLMLYDMAMRGQYNGETGRVVAERLGLNYTQALNCQASSDLIQRNIRLGDAAGVTGTPAVRVRVNNGDLTWITVGGQPLDSGGVPFELLAQFVDNQNAG